MMEVVTFETAKALKAAGFPQPEPKAGQVWYNDWKESFVLHDTETKAATKLKYPYTFDYPGPKPGDVFAPTAADILKLIDSRMRFDQQDGVFKCDNNYYHHGGSDIGEHKNSAEAAAQGFFDDKCNKLQAQ